MRPQPKLITARPECMLLREEESSLPTQYPKL